jgi:hypothetical protein
MKSRGKGRPLLAWLAPLVLPALLLPLALPCACKSGGPAARDLHPAGDRGIDAEDRGVDSATPVKQIGFKLEQRVVVARPATGHLAFPSVTRRADGQLLVAYRLGASHVDSSGRIMRQLGTAGGTSWKPAKVLVDTPGIDDRDPSLATLASGDVALSYFCYATASTAGGTLILHHIFYCVSTDGGETLGPCTQVDGGVMSSPKAAIDASSGLWVDGQGKPLMVMATSSPVVEAGQRLLLPAYGGETLNLGALATAPRSRIALYDSGDGGKTWTARPVNPGQDKQVWQQEPALLPVAPGRWLLQIRTSSQTSPGGAGFMAQASSGDGGKTWSAFTSLGFIGHAPDLLRLENGVLLSAYRGLDATYSRASVALVASTDGGEHWGKPVTVVDCGKQECGYPSLLELAGDRLLLVYYAPGGTAIEGAIYSFTAS